MNRNLATAASVAVLLFATPAAARWSIVAHLNVRHQWPAIVEAAEEFGVQPELLAATCAHETYMRPVRGRYNPRVWGPCQVSWPTWGAELRRLGIAERAEDLLTHRAGLRAGAFVLAELGVRYRRSTALTLCLYAVGTKALDFERDCSYSRGVMANIERVRRARR